MKPKLFFILPILLLLASCQTRVATTASPLRDNTLELYQKYTIQTQDAKIQKITVLRQDAQKIYGKNKSGEEVVIDKSDVREVKKFNLLNSLLVGAGAIVAFILIPV